MKLTAPSGAAVEARDDAVKALLDMGFTKAKEEGEKPKQPRRRAAKTKE